MQGKDFSDPAFAGTKPAKQPSGGTLFPSPLSCPTALCGGVVPSAAIPSDTAKQAYAVSSARLLSFIR